MVTGRTKGLTLRGKGNVVLVAAQLDDADGNPTEQYVLLRADEFGRLRTIDAGAIATFLGLTDTPGSYAGQALLFPRVNAAEDALEFVAAGVDISCRATHSLAQSIPNNAFTDHQFDGETFDTDTMHDNVTNNERITINTAGKYVIVGAAQFAANATGVRIIRIILNAVTPLGAQRYTGPSAGAGQEMMIVTIYDLVVGDFLTLEVFQNSGGALNSGLAADQFPRFAAIKVLG